MNKHLSNYFSRGKYFQFNKLKIFYIHEGKGPNLLIFHGYPYNGYDFIHLLPLLLKHFTVTLPDMPGMGFSDKPDNHAYSFEEMADMYTSLLKELNIESVHVLAHDLGNSVVQELLARDIEGRNFFNIKSIAFLNGGLFTDVYKPRPIQILLSKSPKPIGRILSRIMTKSMVSNATSEVFGNQTKPSEELLNIFWEILNFNNGKSLAYLLGRLIFQKEPHQERWIKAMQQTKIPMCYINGPADPNSGIHMAKRFMQLIPNADVKLLADDIGHWPQIEATVEVYQYYCHFLTDHHISSH